MRNTRYLVWRVNKWRKGNKRQGLPVHRIHPDRIFPPALLKTRMLVRMWQVNSHKPRSGHCHFISDGLQRTPLPVAPHGKAMNQDVTQESPFHLAFCWCFSQELLLRWLWRQISTSGGTFTFSLWTFFPTWKDWSRNVYVFDSDNTGSIFRTRMENYWKKLEQVRWSFYGQINL